VNETKVLDSETKRLVSEIKALNSEMKPSALEVEVTDWHGAVTGGVGFAEFTQGHPMDLEAGDW
jgi:hypothetical protein